MAGQEAVKIALLTWLALSLAGAARAERLEGRLVSQVELVLEGGAPPDEAYRLIGIRAGDTYSPRAIRQSIKQLFALGTFSDIKVEAEPQNQGVALAFHLFPVVKVRQVLLNGLGDDPKPPAAWREALLEESAITPGEPLEVGAVEQAAVRLTERLRREGFLWGRVEPEIQFGGSEATVVFHVEPGRRAHISQLRIEGVQPHTENHLRREIRLAPGESYSRDVLHKRLEEILAGWKARGFYLAQVEISETPEPPDLVAVDLKVTVGPRVIVRVEGAEISDRTLRRLLTVWREASLSEDLVEESRANLEEHFRERGYSDADVAVETNTQEGGHHLLLQFLIRPGEKIEVASVSLEGLSSLQPEEVLPLLATRPRSRFRPAPFRKRVWEADFKEVRTLLRRKGFHRAKVSGDIRRREDGPGIVDLVVLVEEGPRAIIESVDVDGSQQVPSTEVLAHANLKPGAYFDASAVVAARERLVNLYRNRGFHEAVVDARTELDPTETRAAVSFRIWEGRQTVVDQVILAGLEVTREDTVRREVTLASRAPLSAEALLETRQRLIGTGLFSDVNIEPLPTNPFTASSNVLITLEEAPRTSFGYGFGYNERELARVEAELTRRNLFGLNRTASLFSRVSLRGSRFITTYRQPRTFGRDTPLVATTFREDQDRPTFDFVGWGVGLQLSKKISESETLFFRYNFEKTRVFQLEVERRDLPRRFREIDLRLSTVSISGVTDTRDDPVDPSQGQFRIVDFEYAPAFLGSRSPYVKGLARQFWYFPLPRRMVAVLGVRVGVAQSLQEDIDTVIPITKRFFAGGASTLRGFGLDLASPRRNLPGPDGLFRTEDDIKGEPVGGNVLTLVNLELRFPIAGKLGGVVFSDNGTVYRRLQVIQLLNWRYNLGLGFRYQTPLGPLRVDWGFKVDRLRLLNPLTGEKEPRSRIHVSLGHAF